MIITLPPKNPTSTRKWSSHIVPTFYQLNLGFTPGLLDSCDQGVSTPSFKKSIQPRQFNFFGGPLNGWGLRMGPRYFF